MNQSDGGGLFMSTGCTALLNDQSEISGNEATGRGSGIYQQNGAVLQIQRRSSVHDNSGGNGGGIYLNAATASIGLNNSTPSIYGNTTTGNGGGIYVSDASTLGIAGTTDIVNNSAPNSDGGGIYTEDTTYVNLTTGNDTLFSGNRAIAAYIPPADTKILYPNIGFESTSIADHPLNNYDINFTDGALLTYHVVYNANGGTESHTGPEIMSGGKDTCRH